MTIDKRRLIKLLRMTESSQDAEVLAAIRKSNAMLRAAGKDWSDLLEPPPPPAPEPARPVSVEWSRSWRAGYVRSDGIRNSVRREFPISLAFFPLWIVAELMAILFPGIYWNRSSKRMAAAFWSLCGLGVLSWLGAGAYLLVTFAD
ncbi:hypothetical protein [Reyranella sp.]|uniref:hypothetical protein n=1 Tax=Reyranella sp. TaxID=1929291 RepID=UPI003BA908DC